MQPPLERLRLAGLGRQWRLRRRGRRCRRPVLRRAAGRAAPRSRSRRSCRHRAGSLVRRVGLEVHVRRVAAAGRLRDGGGGGGGVVRGPGRGRGRVCAGGSPGGRRISVPYGWAEDRAGGRSGCGDGIGGRGAGNGGEGRGSGGWRRAGRRRGGRREGGAGGRNVGGDGSVGCCAGVQQLAKVDWLAVSLGPLGISLHLLGKQTQGILRSQN